MSARGGMARRPRWALLGVLPLDCGGCGACAQSIQALRAPRYARALRQARVTFARGPRQADVVLLAGALTKAAQPEVARALAAVPEPRVLVAVGDCAIDGCVFRGSPTLVASAAEALDVHVEIAGCPPAPAAILDAILAAKRLLSGEDGAEMMADAGVEHTAVGQRTTMTGGGSGSEGSR